MESKKYSEFEKTIQKPLISVIMSIFNEQKYIEQSIESILNQTEQDFEFIIYDDHSNDGTTELIRKIAFEDERIRLFEMESNRGLTVNLNSALSQARGKYIARMDGDDICHPKRFEKQIQFLDRNPEIMLCSCTMLTIGETRPLFIHSYTQPESIKCFLLLNPALPHPGFMFRAELYWKYGFQYDETFRQSQDYDFMARVAHHYKLGNLKDTLVKYRVHVESVTLSQSGGQRKHADRVRFGLLKGLGVQLNEEEWDVYRKLTVKEQVDTNDEYRQAFDIIEHIIDSNKKVDMYQQDILKETLIREVAHWMLRNERLKAVGLIVAIRRQYLYWFFKELAVSVWWQRVKPKMVMKNSFWRKDEEL